MGQHDAGGFERKETVSEGIRTERKQRTPTHSVRWRTSCWPFAPTRPGNGRSVSPLGEVGAGVDVDDGGRSAPLAVELGVAVDASIAVESWDVREGDASRAGRRLEGSVRVKVRESARADMRWAPRHASSRKTPPTKLAAKLVAKASG
jgi:hypothetical protein